MSKQYRTTQAVLLSAALLLSGCRVGPNYVKPTAPLAPTFREAGPSTFDSASGWKTAQPTDAADRGKWWVVFNDPQLNGLEEQVNAQNQTLQQAEANYRVSRSQIRVSRANLYPTVGAGVGTGATRDSANQPYFTSSNANNGEGNFQLSGTLNWELDLWGKLRRGVTVAKENAQASASDLENARLSLHAELALDYFDLRGADAQKKLLDDTVKAYRDALQLTQDRYDGGLAPLSDVAQAKTQLQQTIVQDDDVTVTRQQLEHAIAVLVGKTPEEVIVAMTPLTIQPPALPVIPGVLPSQLLERRPDIAAEERRMAAANEQIGIAQAAYYPDINLGASAGFLGTSVLNWFTWPSRFFSVGPSATQTLFDAGRRRAVTEIARANYDNTIAGYRQAALTGFQQVEDSLVALRVLEKESDDQRQATDAANQSLDLFKTRYEGGVDTYLQVITAQTTALQNQRNDIEIMRRRLDASVLLIKALGGGWSVAQLPPV